MCQRWETTIPCILSTTSETASRYSHFFLAKSALEHFGPKAVSALILVSSSHAACWQVSSPHQRMRCLSLFSTRAPKWSADYDTMKDYCFVHLAHQPPNFFPRV